MGINTNVVRRHLEAVADQEVAEIKKLLGDFERVLGSLVGRGQDLLDNPTRISLMTLAGVVRAAFTYVKRGGLELAFFLLIKHYVMAPKDRKVLEKASKTYAKRSMNRIKPEKAEAAYHKMVSEMTLFLDTARKVVREGKGHTDEGSTTVWKAGPFNLINTGGFDDKKMKEVQSTVEKAAQLIQSKGFGKICYGDIQITNTVGRSSSVLAFYLVSKDELYVRANLKNKKLALHNIIHELGHRLRYKFMKSELDAVRSLYRSMEDRDALALAKMLADPSLQPKAGDTLEDGSITYTVLTDGVKTTPKGTFVMVSKKGKVVGIPLSIWMREKTPLGFVSSYAKSDPEENFAEMFSFYVQGKLEYEYVELFEAVVK